MFTGIIREIGTVVRRERRGGVIRLSVGAPATAARVEPLESVSVNGVCLSVVQVRQGSLIFEVIPETQRLTGLSTVRAGTRVNLEPSLSVADRLGGQLLFGHVDGLGHIVRCRQASGERVLEIRVGPALRRFLVLKGPVALDGVSLTVGRLLKPGLFAVHLIPETLRRTTLSVRKAGDAVNVELDYIAKLIWQFTHSRNGTRQT